MALDRQIQVSVRQMLSPGASIARLLAESARLRVESSHVAIQEVVALLMGSESIRWKPLAQSDGQAVCEVLLCPGDGGAGIDGYRPLAQSLLEGATAAVSAADGLLSAESQHAESLDDLAEVLRQRCTSEHRDLILLGHSWGATLALVLARGLVAAGRAVKAVWLLDPSAEHLAPDLPTHPVAEEALSDLLAMMLRLVSQGTAAAWGAARQVLQDAYHAACMGNMTDVQEGLGGSWLCVQRATTRRSRNLGLRPLSLGPLPVPIHVMLARREAESSADAMRRCEEVEDRLGQISTEVSVAWACGGHHSMIEPANCASLVTGLLQSTDFLCGT